MVNGGLARRTHDMTDRFEAIRRSTIACHLTLVLAVAACGGDQQTPADTARAPAPADAPVPRGVEVVPQMFRTLSWIEGRWRGTDSAQLVFYEEYRRADDSTIVMRSFSDSMFSTATDSSTVALRGGRVENVSANATWVATTFNGNSVHFAPVKGARNTFTWERAAGGWTARILPPDGSTRQRIYHMTPMSR